MPGDDEILHVGNVFGQQLLLSTTIRTVPIPLIIEEALMFVSFPEMVKIELPAIVVEINGTRLPK
jgi:hypothetical protein